MAAVCEPVEECCYHFCVTEDLHLFTKAKVGRDDDAGALIDLAQKVEQQRTARQAERQIADFIKDNQVDFGQHLGPLPSLPNGFLLFQRIDEFDARVEAHFASVMLNGLDADSCSDMAFVSFSSRPTDQTNVFRFLYELATMEMPDGGLIDLARRKVTTCEVFVGWEACHLCVTDN